MPARPGESQPEIERRDMAWLINFSLTVSLGMIFVYQCAYKWEFAATVQGMVPGNESATPASTQPTGAATTD